VSPAAPRAGRPPALRYRPARRTDVEALAELGARAYRVASVEKRREFYTDHPRFGLRDVRVGELDGAIVASLVLYPFEAWVRGRKLPVAGIGSVAVSPEHRRRGVADALLRATLRELRVSSRPLSMLAPFRDAFYRKFGWGTCEIVHQFAFAPANLATFDEARALHGKVFALVACAGIGGPNGPGAGDRFDDLVATNLGGTYACLRAAERKERVRDDRHARLSALCDLHTVVDTPRRARPSIARTGDNQIAL